LPRICGAAPASHRHVSDHCANQPANTFTLDHSKPRQLSTMTPAQTAEAVGYSDAVRRQIEHEDILIVNRLSWLMASQSFLFTAYAIILNGPTQLRTVTFVSHGESLLKIIPIMAISACVLIYLGICGGIGVMASLRREFARHHATLGNLRPPIQGSGPTLFLGHCAPLGLPPIFTVAWAILLFTR
jgi:hypothetical protein